LGDEVYIAISFHNLGYVAQHQGDSRQAIAHFQESLARNRQLGEDVEGIALCLAGIGAVGQEWHQPAWAVSLFAAATRILDSLGARMVRADRADYEHALAATRAQLDERSWAAAWAEGQTLSLEQAIARATEADMPIAERTSSLVADWSSVQGSAS
jgi:hypothetical protein